MSKWVMLKMKCEEEEVGEVKERRVVKAVEVEDEEFVRIGLTMPSSLLEKLDEAASLYKRARSRLIQEACEAYVEALIGTDWLKEILQRRDVKYGSLTKSYSVDNLIDAILDEHYIPGIDTENATYLTPTHLKMIKKALEKEKTIGGKNKWEEFCSKFGLDPNEIPEDRAIKLIFEIEEIEEE
jgi:predicted DNA-binding protein